MVATFVMRFYPTVYTDWLLYSAVLWPLLVSVVLLRRGRQQRRKSHRLAAVTERYILMHQALDDYVNLIVGYMPLINSKIVQTFERITAQHLVENRELQPLQQHVQAYMQQSSALLTQNDDSISRTKSQEEILFGRRGNPLKSGIFWLTIFVQVAVGISALQLGKSTISWSAIAALLVIINIIFMLSYRRYSAAHSLLKATEEQARQNAFVLDVRRTFATDFVTTYEKLHTDLLTSSQKLTHVPQAREFFSGLVMLAKLTKQTATVQRASDLSGTAPLFAVSSALQKRAQNAYAPAAVARHITFEVHIDEGLAFHINGLQLQVLVDSLVENAFTYCPSGSRVAIRGSRHGQKVMIAVMDDGPGMNKEQLQSLFVPMSKRTSSNTFQPTTMSLGLQVAKVIVARIGGELQINSRPGKGTRATILAPRQQTDLTLHIPRKIQSRSGQLAGRG